MRYSIIHHDVKEKFSLTIGEYLVCDSIQQLSYHRPYKKPLTEIGEFLGFSEKTVWRARDILIEKGLIELHDGGFRITEKWSEALTESKKTPDKMSGQTGQNVRPTGQNVRFSPLYKERKEDNLSAFAEVIVIEDSEDQRTSKKMPKDEQALSLVGWAEKRRGFKFTSVPAQLGAIGRAKKANISPTRLKNRWGECEDETWRNGFDWTDVVKTFDRRP